MAVKKQIKSDKDISSKAKVSLWGNDVGDVIQYENGRVGFAYSKEYIQTGPSLSPRHLPLEPRTFEFPELRSLDAFLGLPGVFADSLPDSFGNLIIRGYFESKGEPEKALSPVQRLLYVGNRAMGALEYSPHLQRKTAADEVALEIKELVESARKLIEGDTSDAIQEIMKVGGSAGGARAKALILWDKKNNKVRSGYAKPRQEEEAWLIKFDGVGSANALDMKAKPHNRIEYTYAKIAKLLGIDMAEVDYQEDKSGLFHFMTKRFDRAGVEKHHMHSLGGMTHVDFNRPQSYSYEAWFRLILELKLGYPALEQAYKRMIFNIVGRNQDDHVKNIAFIMKGESKQWELAPAYDLTYAAGSGYTVRHQMTLGGLSDGFTRKLILDTGINFDINNPSLILDEIIEEFSKWPTLAKDIGVEQDNINAVTKSLRLAL